MAHPQHEPKDDLKDRMMKSWRKTGDSLMVEALCEIMALEGLVAELMGSKAEGSHCDAHYTGRLE